MIHLARRRKKLSTRFKAKARPNEGPAKTGIIRGTISYPWGAVGNARVTVGSRSIVADKAGKYEILITNPGVFDVTVSAPFPGYEASTQNVSVALDEETVVDFHLDYESTLLHGHVYDHNAEPIPGAILSGVISGNNVGAAVTDEKGYFRFHKARLGNQFIRVNAEGYMPQTKDFTARKGEAIRLDFHLTRGVYEIQGVVVDENDRPIRAEVILSSKSGMILQRIQSKPKTGYFEFSVLPGQYNLLAMASGRESRGWYGQVLSDHTINFKLQPILVMSDASKIISTRTAELSETI